MQSQKFLREALCQIYSLLKMGEKCYCLLILHISHQNASLSGVEFFEPFHTAAACSRQKEADWSCGAAGQMALMSCQTHTCWSNVSINTNQARTTGLPAGWTLKRQRVGHCLSLENVLFLCDQSNVHQGRPSLHSAW